DTDLFSYDDLYAVFSGLKAGKYAKEAIPAILKEMATGTDLEAAVKKLGVTAVGADEAAAIIEKIVKEREDFVRAKGMAAIGGLMGPVMGALRGKIDGKQANELLTAAIKKLLG
ncbi:MAG: Glu-tRNA(Gln) amidotransferase GatDE subunit E, partial [Methanomethylophilus sp.]|nr:Glu-tRNA(Gln) amidotransferase GatDE subunit E [Methanomethylophilus sp.]